MRAIAATHSVTRRSQPAAADHRVEKANTQTIDRVDGPNFMVTCIDKIGEALFAASPTAFLGGLTGEVVMLVARVPTTLGVASH
jgi:hypothetical protein